MSIQRILPWLVGILAVVLIWYYYNAAKRAQAANTVYLGPPGTGPIIPPLANGGINGGGYYTGGGYM